MGKVLCGELLGFDVLACYGRDIVSRAISLQTVSPFGPARLRWGPAHVAFCLPVKGETLWCESTALCRRPCYLTGQVKSGCQAHLPEDRRGDYVGAGGRVEVYRPSGIWRREARIERFAGEIFARHFAFANVAYDFGGAAVSGTRLWKWLPWATHDVMHSLFCSELLAAFLMRFGLLPLGNVTRYNPASLLRELVGFGFFSYVGDL